MNEKIENAIRGAFVADAYVLGAHWVYDEAQLKTLPIDWEHLNAPQAMWHKGKVAGDFTHYGDHTLWLLEYVKENKAFTVESYAAYWQAQMKSYQGYIDGSSRECLEHLQAGRPAECGPVNHDLSICGRIAPILLVAKDKDDFVSKAIMFAKMTHNDALVLEATHYFASLLWDVLEGVELSVAMTKDIKDYSPKIQAWINEGIQSREGDSATAIRAFGPACGVDGGFAGTIHLLAKYSDFKQALQENAKAGGDSAARGMIVGMILGALKGEKAFPWEGEMNQSGRIRTLLAI